MTNWSQGERLYGLLPATYRTRDDAQGEPLRALLAVIERELEIVEGDIEGLYDNWFIETCDEWVVPYIADLLGVRLPHPVGSAGLFSLRAYVANTLAYRRRKGTAAVLEQLARDVTGWPSRAVEFFLRLSTTQHVNHVRPDSLATADLRDADALERLGGPFERATHSADVRRIARERGRYNVPNVGLFLWRLQSYPVERAVARAVATPSDGRYTVHPLGCNQPLFNRPQTETAITQVTGERNVPGPLRRRPLHDDLEALRQALADGTSPAVARQQAAFFGEEPVFRLFRDGVEVAPARLMICNLATWREPPETLPYHPADGGPPVELPIEAALDPALGRLRFRADDVPGQVEVSYAYGFSADIGGGPYDRRATMAPRTRAALVIPVAKGTATDTLQKALVAWQAAGEPPAIFQIQDNGVYGGNLDVTLPPGGWLVIEAANRRQPSVRFVGLTTLRGPEDATLRLDGLLIEGALQLDGDLTVEIVHSTLVPGRMLNDDCTPANPDRDSIVVLPGPNTPEVHIAHSIVGPLRLPETARGLSLRDSIVDAPMVGGETRPAIAASNGGTVGPPTTLERATLFGPVVVRQLDLASEVIFTEPVVVSRRQVGCVRFSFVPEGSRTPQRYRCQPDLALREAAEAQTLSVDDLPPAEVHRIRTRLRPRFTAEQFSDPAFAQLSHACAAEIRTGAEDGAEMGVFHDLMQPHREANLRAALDEYLRFGLEAGVLFVT